MHNVSIYKKFYTNQRRHGRGKSGTLIQFILFYSILFSQAKKTECGITELSSIIVVLMSYYNGPVIFSLSTSYNVVQRRLVTVDIFSLRTFPCLQSPAQT